MAAATPISNPSESHQADIIASAVICWVIGAVFVGLRFYARAVLLRNAIGIEDWLIVVALIFSALTSAGAIEQAAYGYGKHMLDIDYTKFSQMMRAGWLSILWYGMSLLFTKIAICLLYLRVLSFRHARYVVYAALTLVVVLNGVYTLYVILTACNPLTAFWSYDPTATCRPDRDWYLNTGLHIGTDFMLYILPLPVVVSLRVNLRQKMALYGVMVLGLLVCLLSVVRFWDITEQNTRLDYSYENTSINHLTAVEPNAAIACACCMTLRPLMNKWFPHLWTARSSSSDGAAPDVEMGGAAAGRGASNETRGPPTIGSQPLRKMMMRRGDSQLLDEGHDDFGDAQIRDEKRSIQTDTDAASFTETGSGSGTSSGTSSTTPTQPRP